MTSSKTQDILDDDIIDLTDILEEGPGKDSQAKKLFGDLMPKAGAKTSKLTDNTDVDALLNDLDSFEGDSSLSLRDNKEQAPSQAEADPVVDIADMDDLFNDLDMPAPGAVAAPASKADASNDNAPLNPDDLDGLLSSLDFQSKASNLVKEEPAPAVKKPQTQIAAELDLDDMLDSMTPKGSKSTDNASFSSLDDLLEASYDAISPESKAAVEKSVVTESSLPDAIINLDSLDNEVPTTKDKNSSLFDISLDDLLSQDSPVAPQVAGNDEANSPFSFDEIETAMKASVPASQKAPAMGGAAQKEHILGPEVNELPIDALDKVLGGLDDLLQDPPSQEQHVSVDMERLLQLEEDIQANAENHALGLAAIEQRLGAIEDALDASKTPQNHDEDNISQRLEQVEAGLLQLTNTKEEKLAAEVAEAVTPTVFSQEQDDRLRAMEATLEEQGSRLAGLESRLDGIDSTLGGLISKMSSYDTTLSSLEDKLTVLDTRFSEEPAPVVSEALEQRIVDLEKAAQSAANSTVGDSMEHMDSVPMLESAVSDLLMEDGPVRDNFSSFVRGMVLSELMLADNVPPYVEAMAEDLLKLQMDVEAGQEKLRTLSIAKDAAPDMQEPLDIEAALVPLKAELLGFLQATVEKSAAAAAAKVIREEIKNLLLLMADDGQDEEAEELEEELEVEEIAGEALEAVGEVETLEAQPASEVLFGDIPLDFSDLLTSSAKNEEQDPLLKAAAEAAISALQEGKSPDDMVMDELDALLSAVVEAAPDPGLKK